jgi:hypothetical protein
MSKSPLFIALVSCLLGFGCSTGSNSSTNGIPNVTVKVTPLTATLGPSGQQQFTATVTGDSNTAVSWSVGGLACSVAQECGSVTTNGLYTAPGAVSSSLQVTVSAVSQANAFDSGSAEIILNPPPTSAALRGAYSYLLSGSDVKGRLSVAGKFIADGAGSIHSGEMSFCRGEQCDSAAFAGTYVEHSAQQGTIGLDAFPKTLLHFTQNESGKFELDMEGESGLRAEGIMEPDRPN